MKRQLWSKKRKEVLNVTHVLFLPSVLQVSVPLCWVNTYSRCSHENCIDGKNYKFTFSHPLFFSPFPITVFQKVSLRKNTICLCEANIIEHNLLSYLDLLCSSYNLPARHKLNLHCFLWLTIEHKFNRPLIQGFSFPLTRGQCKTLFWSHDCQPLWLQTTLALSAEVDVCWCLKSTIALIRHCSHDGVNLGSEKKE